MSPNIAELLRHLGVEVHMFPKTDGDHSYEDIYNYYIDKIEEYSNIIPLALD